MLPLDWDDADRNHIARHGITDREVEEVFAGNPLDLEKREEDGELRFSYLGATARGRILLVVMTERQDRLRPVTAFEPASFLKRLFLQSRRSHEDE